MTPGNIHDCTQAPVLLANVEAAAVIADKGYDSDAILELIGSRGALAVIPPTRCRKIRRRYDKSL